MNVEFPDLYDDMGKACNIALYHAHCDFDPFITVIKNNEISIKALNEYYHNLSRTARENNDWITEDNAMRNSMIYMARAVPYSYYSLVIIMMSLLEEAFNTLCRAYAIVEKKSITYEAIEGTGLDRAFKYLEKEIGIHKIKKNSNWDFVKAIRMARNCIVHDGGFVKKEKREFLSKHGFYICDESSRVLFESDEIYKIYDTIVSFIDETFIIEPTKGGGKNGRA
jgi:hypothetical protein